MASGAKTGNGLTVRQMKAIKHYVANGSMVEAYRHAYSTKNMKPETVQRCAARVFHEIPAVAAKVLELQKRAEDEAVLDRNEALQILTQIARGKLPTYMDDRGDIKAQQVAEGGADLEEYSVSESVSESGTVTTRRKVKVRNPIQAIERIAKMCGWDKPDKLQVDGVTFNLNLGEG